MDQAWLSSLDEEQQCAVADVEVNLDADEVQCPACGAQFAPTSGRCPDCDLNLGG